MSWQREIHFIWITLKCIFVFSHTALGGNVLKSSWMQMTCETAFSFSVTHSCGFSEFTWTLARTTSMGLVIVEAVAAAIGPATACRIRWGHSLGANRDNCSGNTEDTK